MIFPLFVFLPLAHVVKGISTDTTSPNCQLQDDGSTRSLWSILWSCALTLLICVWHVAHPGIPNPRYTKWYDRWRHDRMGLLVIWCFCSPEVIVAVASYERLVAKHICKKFQEREFAYEWSVAHSHFAQMGGFVYCSTDSEGGSPRAINSSEYLDLCEKKRIINANITKEDIMDKSKSDFVGKAVYGVQLLWFILQIAVRHFSGLDITLVELDTGAMAVLSLLILWLWLDKPLRPERPHIFYSPEMSRVYPQLDLITEWKCFPRDPILRTSIAFSSFGQRSGVMKRMAVACLEQILGVITHVTAVFSRGQTLPSWTTQTPRRQNERHTRVAADVSNIRFESVAADDQIHHQPVDLDLHKAGLQLTLVLCVTWIVLGGIHLMAWNADFPTWRERILWRAGSLVLTGLPLTIVIAWGILWVVEKLGWCDRHTAAAWTHGVVINVAQFGTIVRLVLAGLMLASLRAIPCSAYQTISWTDYIPHL